MVFEEIKKGLKDNTYEEAYLTDSNCIILFAVEILLRKAYLSVISRETGRKVKPDDELVDVFKYRTNQVLKEYA